MVGQYMVEAKAPTRDGAYITALLAAYEKVVQTRAKGLGPRLDAQPGMEADVESAVQRVIRTAAEGYVFCKPIASVVCSHDAGLTFLRNEGHVVEDELCGRPICYPTQELIEIVNAS